MIKVKNGLDIQILSYWSGEILTSENHLVYLGWSDPDGLGHGSHVGDRVGLQVLDDKTLPDLLEQLVRHLPHEHVQEQLNWGNYFINLDNSLRS